MPLYLAFRLYRLKEIAERAATEKEELLQCLLTTYGIIHDKLLSNILFLFLGLYTEYPWKGN